MIDTSDKILDKVRKIISEFFEIELDKIKLESRLNEDLGLDSIDAIDLINHLQVIVGQRLKPEEFKSVRTIADLIEAAQNTLNQSKPD